MFGQILKTHNWQEVVEHALVRDIASYTNATMDDGFDRSYFGDEDTGYVLNRIKRDYKQNTGQIQESENTIGVGEMFHIMILDHEMSANTLDEFGDITRAQKVQNYYDFLKNRQECI